MAFNTNDVKKTIDSTCSANTDGWEILVRDDGCWAKKDGYLVCLDSHDLMRGFFLGAEVAGLIEADQSASDYIATLKFDIDYSAATEARDEFNKLKDAVDALADSYDRLNDAMNGPVEYSGTIEPVDRLIKELLSGVSR